MVALWLCGATCGGQRHSAPATKDTAVYEQVGILTQLTSTEAGIRSYGLDGKAQQATFVLNKDAIEGTVHVSQVVRVVYQRNGAKLVASKLTAVGAGEEPRNASPSLGIYGTSENVPQVYLPGEPPLVRAAYDPSEPVSSGLPLDAVRPQIADLLTDSTGGPRTLSFCQPETEPAFLLLGSVGEFFVVVDSDDAVPPESFSLVTLGAETEAGSCHSYEVAPARGMSTKKVSDRVFGLSVASVLRPGRYAFLVPVKEKAGSVVVYSFIVPSRGTGAFGNIEADSGKTHPKDQK